MTLFGTGFGPANIVVNTPVNGYFGTSLSGTTVSIGGVLAPIIYTSATLVSAIVPYEVAGSAQAAIQVLYAGSPAPSWSVPVVAAAPSVFTVSGSGVGQGSVVNADGDHQFGLESSRPR